MSLSTTDEWKFVKSFRTYLNKETLEFWAVGALISDLPPPLQKKAFLLFISILRAFAQRKGLGLGNNPIHHQLDEMAEHLLSEYDRRGGM